MNFDLIDKLDIDIQLDDITCPLAQDQVHGLANTLMGAIQEQADGVLLLGGEFFTSLNGMPHRMASNAGGWVIAELKYLRGCYQLLGSKYLYY